MKDLEISNTVNLIEPSLTRHLFNLAKNFDDTIDLTLGDPDLGTPEEIREAGCRAIREGKTRYTPNAGIPELRAALAKNVSIEYGVQAKAENIAVTVGGMEGLYLSLLCIVNTCDEVIVFEPYYVNYVQMIRMCGGVPVIVPAYIENKGFSLINGELDRYITSRTKAIILNSPNNPTGDVLSDTFISAVADAARKNNLYIISDEVYRSIIYTETEYTSILKHKDLLQNIILVDSFSKKYCMTGWRVGYLFANEELIVAVTKTQENVAACVPGASQYAALEAAEKNIDTDYITKEFKKRCDVLVEKLKTSKLLSCVPPKGALYAFVNISKTNLKSYDFALKLLEEKHVAVVPGVAYGKNYDDYIRIAFTLNSEKLALGCEKIIEFADELLEAAK